MIETRHIRPPGAVSAMPFLTRRLTEASSPTGRAAPRVEVRFLSLRLRFLPAWPLSLSPSLPPALTLSKPLLRTKSPTQQSSGLLILLVCEAFALLSSYPSGSLVPTPALEYPQPSKACSSVLLHEVCPGASSACELSFCSDAPSRCQPVRAGHVDSPCALEIALL